MTNTTRDALIRDNLPLADRLGASAARRLHPLAEADDLIQEARLALVLAAGRCDDRDPIPYLIATIKGALQHYVRDKIRMVRVSRREHEKHRPPFSHGSLDVRLPCGTPLGDLLPTNTTEQADTDLQELEAMAERLPAADAAALRLTVLQGLPLRTAAEMLNVSAMTVQRRRERAIAVLREALQA